MFDKMTRLKQLSIGKMKILPIVQLIICCFTQHIVYSSTTEIPIPVYNEAVPIETANSFQYSYVVKLTVQFEGKGNEYLFFFSYSTPVFTPL